MADVLLGRTDGIEGFERHVVLKRIRPEHARDQRFIRMFLDEARVAANLHHQHIVQVHDIGESAGEYFIAMEYIHGEDVRTILSTASKVRAHVPLGVAIAIVSAAAAGLHYAHERRGADKRPLGIVHRDVSPSNILVGYDGSIKVVDFGIAKATMRQETRSGALKGKVSYMSPEQCKSDDIDRRSDVYSLGVVLYELATTTRLFKGDNDYLVMDQIVNGRVSLPQVRRPDLPNELSAIVMRALAPDPERRFFTADELRVSLDQFANRVGITASTSQLASYMRKQFGERPEPWLELGGQVVGTLDDVATSIGELRANSWTELPRSDDSRRSSVAIPRITGPMSSISGPVPMSQTELVPDVAAHSSTERGSVIRLPSVPPPTDSKMGWESQPPPQAATRFTPAKVALICAPLIVLLGVAIWLLAGTGATQQVAVVPKPAPIAAQPPALVVTPIPDPPKPPPDVAAAAIPPEPVAPAPVAPAPVHTSEPPKHQAQSSPKRAERVAATKPVEAPASAAPPLAKIETPAAAPPQSLPITLANTLPPPPAPPASAPAQPIPAVTAAPVPAPPAAVTPPPVAVAAAPQQQEIGLPRLGQALVERVASDHSGELSRCDGDEQLHGDITVNFMIDGNGRVSNAQVATAIRKPKVLACIIHAFRGFVFPKQGPGGATGSYTLTFQ